jgi:hypothetical protein
MLGKILVIAGGSIVALGSVGIAAAIYKSFESLKINESAGIGAVGGELGLALLGAVVSIIGLLLFVAGIIVFVVNKRRSTGQLK